MILTITEEEVKEAVAFWLRERKGIKVKAEDLTAQYDNIREEFTSFTVNYPPAE